MVTEHPGASPLEGSVHSEVTGHRRDAILAPMDPGSAEEIQMDRPILYSLNTDARTPT